MKITELLDKRSISLNGSPKSKSEALDQMVALMAKAVRSTIRKLIEKKYTAGKKKGQRVLEKELRFHTEKALLQISLDLRLWL